MIYVALLRGINVGGNRKVEMAKLKQTFESLGFTDVKTYINSGNVIFETPSKDDKALCGQIEKAIETDFGFNVPVLLRSLKQIEKLLEKLPVKWVNDAAMRCDVMFLWPDIDNREIVAQIPHNPEIEDVVYYPGTVVWRINRENVRRGQVIKIISTDIYKKFTIRNVNTVRKLYALMKFTNQTDII
ncbi:MAG TPA: DUF1697 domain-containing protein [Candidatus Saccharimonadia bacterium]|nr:DUF1697 domain-containing protein [Candidatus Saccharimonadia bacterium]